LYVASRSAAIDSVSPQDGCLLARVDERQTGTADGYADANPQTILEAAR
jgi:hypothetical protein